MKIAYLNPFTNAAENQAYMSLAAAGRNVGIHLISCQDESDLERSGAEFVISVSSSVPKIADIPSYLTVHEPTRRFRENAVYFKNMLSYDGYATISDSLKAFVQNVTYGAGRLDPVGFYFNTPQRSSLTADIVAAARDERLRLVYLGTNWDRRLPRLFDTLDSAGILRIHGPTGSWSPKLRSYSGALPFDGIAPQRAYADAGVGLVLHSADHMSEDIVSNRIFEIASVGAIPLCPDMPWIRKWFGDSVLYFDSEQPVPAIGKQLISLVDEVRGAPAKAEDMAARARKIFEDNFSAEVLLTNMVKYHEQKTKARRAAAASRRPDPTIAVIMRCGGRPIEDVRKAVASIERQTYGRFKLLFVKWRELDLSSLHADLSPRIVETREISVPKGSRGRSLFAGAAAVRDMDADYFAVLDDDDFWLSDHIEGLFDAAHKCGADFDVIFSGTVSSSREGKEIEKNLFWRRNIHTFGYRDQPRSVPEVTREFSSNCFVARISALPSDLAHEPAMETAEDSHLIALVSRRRRPIFSYRATAFFHADSADSSKYSSHPNRRQDETALLLRSSLLYAPEWLDQTSLQDCLETWRRAEAHHDAKSRRIVVDGVREPRDRSIHEREDIAGRLVSLDERYCHLLGGAAFVDRNGERAIRLAAPGQAWAFLAEIDLHTLVEEDDQYAVIEIENARGLHVGLMNAEGEFVRRVEAPTSLATAELWFSLSKAHKLVVQQDAAPLVDASQIARVWIAKETAVLTAPAERLRSAVDAVKVDIEIGNIDLWRERLHLRRGVTVTNGVHKIPVGPLGGHAIYGPYLNLPAGEWRLSFKAKTWALRRKKAALLVDALFDGVELSRREFAVGELDGSDVELDFTIPDHDDARAGSVETRFAPLVRGGIRIWDIRLTRLPDPQSAETVETAEPIAA